MSLIFCYLIFALQFPTVNEHYDGNFSAALRQLAQPVKLKLQALPSSSVSTGSPDGVVGIVGIESLAPLHLVDNFIYERLNPSAAAPSGSAVAAAANSHKFNLFLNGVALEHGMPIIRAITTSSAASSSVPTRTMSGSGVKSGGASHHAYDSQHPTWSQIHTLHFEPRAEQSGSNASDEFSDACRLSFLDYELAMASSCQVDCSQDVAGATAACRACAALFLLLIFGVSAGALSLLQTIYKISLSFAALHHHAGAAVDSGAAAAVFHSHVDATPLLRNEQFICEKLRLKIMRQISDPIVVCSRDFPYWLSVIGQEFRFLLPCECRTAMLHAMSFNVYRSLHSVVSKHTDASADVRVSRIPRQQVVTCRANSPAR